MSEEQKEYKMDINTWFFKKQLIKNELKELVINKICNNKDFTYEVNENAKSVIVIYTPNIFIEYAIRKSLLDCFLYNLEVLETDLTNGSENVNPAFISLLKKNIIDYYPWSKGLEDQFKYINEFKFYSFQSSNPENVIYPFQIEGHDPDDFWSESIEFGIKQNNEIYFLDWFGDSESRLEENILEPEENMYDYGTVRYSSEGECLNYKDMEFCYWIEFNKDIPFHCRIEYHNLQTKEDRNKYKSNDNKEDDYEPPF